MDSRSNSFAKRAAERRELAALGEVCPPSASDTTHPERFFPYRVLTPVIWVSTRERAWLERERKRAITDLGAGLPANGLHGGRVYGEFPRLRLSRRDRSGNVLATLYCRATSGPARYVRNLRIPFASPYESRLVRLRRLT